MNSGASMPQKEIKTRAGGRRRSIVRTVTVGGKFTEVEAEIFTHRAAANGQLLGEWARGVLLQATSRSVQSSSELALFAEVQSLRLLLINALEPLLRGDKMSAEQFKELLRYVKNNKRKAADEMLASYAISATEE
jgi:hypothetical protein